VGEVEKDQVVRVMRSNVRNSLKDHFLIGTLITWPGHILSLIRRKKYKRRLVPHSGDTLHKG
jgi:hypothetical protein